MICHSRSSENSLFSSCLHTFTEESNSGWYTFPVLEYFQMGARGKLQPETTPVPVEIEV